MLLLNNSTLIQAPATRSPASPRPSRKQRRGIEFLDQPARKADVAVLGISSVFRSNDSLTKIPGRCRSRMRSLLNEQLPGAATSSPDDASSSPDLDASAPPNKNLAPGQEASHQNSISLKRGCVTVGMRIKRDAADHTLRGSQFDLAASRTDGKPKRIFTARIQAR